MIKASRMKKFLCVLGMGLMSTQAWGQAEGNRVAELEAMLELQNQVIESLVQTMNQAEGQEDEADVNQAALAHAIEVQATLEQELAAAVVEAEEAAAAEVAEGDAALDEAGEAQEEQEIPGYMQVYEGDLSDDDEVGTRGYEDTYTAVVEEGQMLVIELTADFDCYLFATSPSGQEHYNDDFNGTDSRLYFLPAETGEWEIRATSFSDRAEGDYTLTVRALLPTEQQQPVAIELDDRGEAQFNGAIDELDRMGERNAHEDIYTLELGEDQWLLLELDGDDFYSYLTVESPDGQRFDNANYNWNETTHLQVTEVIEPGQWVIRVSSRSQDNFGAYRLKVQARTAPEIQDLAVIDGTLNAQDLVMHDGRYADVYTLELEEGDWINIHHDVSSRQPYLVVLTPSRDRIEGEWDRNYGSMYCRFVAEEAGVYRVFAMSSEIAMPADYTLEIQQYLDDE